MPDVTPAGIEAATHLYKYFSDFVADRRAAVAAGRARRSHGRAVSRRAPAPTRSTTSRSSGFLFLLIIAGNETTTKLLANCLLALQRFPAERRKVVADPGRIPDAVEEILRYEGSTQLMARTLTRPVELHGERMPEGAKVLLLLGSANRDERVWDRPDEFDIDRASADAARRLRSRHPRVPRRRARPARDAREPRGDPRRDARLRDRRGAAARACTPATSAAGRRCRSGAAVSAMTDDDAITALIHEYAFRLDAGDLDGVAALFEHAELGSTRHDRRLRGAAEARTLYDHVIIYDDGTPQTMHQITNVTVRVDGDRATARSYFTVLQVTGQGLHPILGRRIPRPLRARRRRVALRRARLRPAAVRRPVAAHEADA